MKHGLSKAVASSIRYITEHSTTHGHIFISQSHAVSQKQLRADVRVFGLPARYIAAEEHHPEGHCSTCKQLTQNTVSDTHKQKSIAVRSWLIAHPEYFEFKPMSDRVPLHPVPSQILSIYRSKIPTEDCKSIIPSHDPAYWLCRTFCFTMLSLSANCKSTILTLQQ